MPNGYTGKILRVNLSSRSITVEEPDENFYRRYYGGRNFISYFLLTEVAPGIDPLGPDNKLIFANGPFTGVALGGSGRNSVGAKSPLTGGYGDGEAGGYFGAEFKHAGYDAIIFEGKADKPVYLWIKDGVAEIRDASHLWGKTLAESEDAIRAELGGDRFIRTAQIGPSGENLVRFAAILNDCTRAIGRTGMGAVMGSKNLKAVAVRGKARTQVADPNKVQEIAKWMSKQGMELSAGMRDLGTAGGIRMLQSMSGLPTRNFREGQFEGFEKIAGDTMRDTILVDRESCYSCPIHCKRVVKVEDRYSVNPRYGGPEYETIGALGSTCGVDDLQAIAKGNELCNAYGLDTISTGVTIAFAMECFENGLLTVKDTDGVRLTFGNGDAMVKMVEMIARRQGIGAMLGEGTVRAAQKIGQGAEQFTMQVKGQEIPMHEPRFKMGLGLGYTISPTGADHCHNMHDSAYMRPGPMLDRVKSLGILEPLALSDMSDDKVRLVTYETTWRAFGNCFIICNFMPYDHNQIVDIARAVTGWNASTFELMKVGERAVTMPRVFNIREGLTRELDRLPSRFFDPFKSGPLEGTAIKREEMERAISSYYQMMGWDAGQGIPTRTKLNELGLGWVADELGK